jgi:hypothetical protein
LNKLQYFVLLPEPVPETSSLLRYLLPQAAQTGGFLTVISFPVAAGILRFQYTVIGGEVAHLTDGR